MTAQIVTGGPADLDRLRPLWLAMHHHHQEVLADQAPFVDDDASWAVRRTLYREVLARPDTILLLALADGEPVGYGLAHVLPAEETWVHDTWSTGPRIGEVESLGVLPGYRGQGIGATLLERLVDGLRAAGVDDLVLGMVPGNRALNLYRRAGFVPSFTYLSKFSGR